MVANLLRLRRGFLRGAAGLMLGGYVSFAFGATNCVDCTLADYTEELSIAGDIASVTIAPRQFVAFGR